MTTLESMEYLRLLGAIDKVSKAKVEADKEDAKRAKQTKGTEASAEYYKTIAEMGKTHLQSIDEQTKTELELLDKKYKEEMALVTENDKKSGEVRAAIEVDYQNKKAKIQEDARKKEESEQKKTYETIAGMANSTIASLSSLFSGYYSNKQGEMSNEHNAEMEALQKEYDAAEGNAAAQETIANKMTALKQAQRTDEKRLAKEKFEQEKAFNIVSIIMNTAQAVIKGISDYGLPWGLIPAGIAAGIGAAQIAIVASQPAPSFATGGNMASGGMALVGERGPEMVQLPGGTRIDSARNTPSMGNNFTFTGNIIANNPIEFYRQMSLKTARAEMGRA